MTQGNETATLPPPNGGRDWSDWLDGRPRRLKRGRDFTGDPKAVAKEAREVAEAAGRVAVASSDSQGRYEYLWVQFVNGEIELGEPCPVCEGLSFAKVQKHFMRCSSCGAVLKAADDREVTAGRFSPPAPVSATEGATADPAADPGPSGEDFAEILGARLLTGDGRELAEPSVAEEFVVEVALRFHRPVLEAVPRLELLVREGGPAVRLHAPEILHPSRPGTVEARVRVPSGLLAPRRYRLGVVLFLRPDASVEAEPLVVWGAPLSFRVLKARASRRLEDFAQLGSALDWEVEGRPDAAHGTASRPPRRAIGRSRRASDAPAAGSHRR